MSLLLLLIFRLVVKISAIDFPFALESICCCILSGKEGWRLSESACVRDNEHDDDGNGDGDDDDDNDDRQPPWPPAPSPLAAPLSIPLLALSKHYENLAFSSSGQIHLHYYKNDYYFCLPRPKRPPTAHLPTHSHTQPLANGLACKCVYTVLVLVSMRVCAVLCVCLCVCFIINFSCIFSTFFVFLFYHAPHKHTHTHSDSCVCIFLCSGDGTHTCTHSHSHIFSTHIHIRIQSLISVYCTNNVW